MAGKTKERRQERQKEHTQQNKGKKEKKRERLLIAQKINHRSRGRREQKKEPLFCLGLRRSLVSKRRLGVSFFSHRQGFFFICSIYLYLAFEKQRAPPRFSRSKTAQTARVRKEQRAVKDGVRRDASIPHGRRAHEVNQSRPAVRFHHSRQNSSARVEKKRGTARFIQQHRVAPQLGGYEQLIRALGRHRQSSVSFLSSHFIPGFIFVGRAQEETKEGYGLFQREELEKRRGGRRRGG